MKELDVMLERFLERQESALAEGGWPELEALLDAEDDRQDGQRLARPGQDDDAEDSREDAHQHDRGPLSGDPQCVRAGER